MSEQPTMETSVVANPIGNQDNKAGFERGLAELKKRKRGRPPGSKNQSKKVASISDGEKPVSGNSPEPSSKDVAFFVESAILIFDSGDQFIKRSFYNQFRQYVKDPERIREFEKALTEASLDDKDREVLRFNLTALALKYEILRKIGPEIGLTIFLIQYSLRQASIARLVAVSRAKPVEKVTQ